MSKNTGMFQELLLSRKSPPLYGVLSGVRIKDTWRKNPTWSEYHFPVDSAYHSL